MYFIHSSSLNLAIKKSLLVTVYYIYLTLYYQLQKNFYTKIYREMSKDVQF
jgi:hypothetical protein